MARSRFFRPAPLLAALPLLLFASCIFEEEGDPAPENVPLENRVDTLFESFSFSDTAIRPEDTTALLRTATHTRRRIARTESRFSQGRLVRTYSEDTALTISSRDSLHRLLAILAAQGNLQDTVTREELLHRESRVEGGRIFTAGRFAVIRKIRKVKAYRVVFNTRSPFGGLSADTVLVNQPDSLLDSVRTEVVRRDSSAYAQDFLFALTSDYAAGSYSILGLDGALLSDNVAPLHSDAVVRYEGGDDILVLNRLGRDNVQLLDRKTLKTVLQFPLPPLSNPYDAVRHGGLLYILTYGHPRILVHRQSDGRLEGSIDLTAYADSADGVAEAVDGLVVGDHLYVLLQNLDARSGYATPHTARLLRIPLRKASSAAGAVGSWDAAAIRALDLPFANPNQLVLAEDGKSLLIPSRGRFFTADFSGFVLDGGIARVDLAAFAAAGTFLPESGLKGSLGAAAVHGGHLYVTVTREADAAELPFGRDELLRVDPGTGESRILATAAAYSLGDLALDAGSKTLFLGDRSRGLRLFDLGSGAEKPGSGTRTGLPISNLAVVR